MDGFAADASAPGSRVSVLLDVKEQVRRRGQYYLDKTVVHPLARWGSFVGLLLIYALRVYLKDGWFIVTYGLGIYLLNLFIGFLTPAIDPEMEGPVLPTRSSEDYRPFDRKVPEFTCWFQAMRGTLIAMCMTFFSMFNIPVFWPILLIYFVVLFTFTMKKQIAHMIKYKYIPFSWGKVKYGGKDGKPAAGGKPAPGSEPRFTGSSLK